MSSVSMLYGKKKSVSGTTLNSSSESSSTNITSVSAEVSTLAPGSPATVAATLSESSLDFQFGLPAGAKGETGDAITPVVGTVESVEYGQDPYVTINTSQQEKTATFNFGFPAGKDGEDADVDYISNNEIDDIMAG